ncbi:MAG: glycosyltransferase family 4 protein [Candidatus Omnitrophica bacterium]|nr:glycosyltransferase family 4 protein [Candidatus Omnitrophota bacterium]
MKILQIVHSLPPYNSGGTEVYTSGLSRELSRRHDVFIVHRVNDPSREEYDVRFRRQGRVNIFEINNTFRECGSFRMLYQNSHILERFSGILKDIRPDIAHIQHLLFLSTDIIKHLKSEGVPVVFTLHDYWMFCQQGQLFNRRNEVCPGPSAERCYECLKYLLGIRGNVMRSYIFLKKYLSAHLLGLSKELYFAFARAGFLKKATAMDYIERRAGHIREMLDMADALISPSHFLRQRFTEFGARPEKIRVLPYGLDYSRFNNISKERGGRTTSVAFIGTLLPAKGADVLIKAFNRLGEADVELNIYGRLYPYKGYEYYTGLLRGLARNKRVRFMGEFHNDDIGSILGRADVLVVPSVWPENSPLVIQEAQLAGVPVIASRTGGIPELITHGENGLLFEPACDQDLYRQLNLFIHDRPLARRLRAGAVMPMSIEENACRVSDVYYEAGAACQPALSLGASYSGI